MSWLSLQTVAQISVERILNALPEGFLIALFAGALLRVFRRQNSGTRFAVWFLALLTLALLPVLGVLNEGRVALGAESAWGSANPAITIPAGWALVAFLAWAVGACVALVRLAAGFWRLRGLRRSCTPIVALDVDPAMQKTLQAIGAGSVTIATSEHVRVPAAIGFFKRTIVLPAWALRELAPADLNVILLHEFAHLRRGDDWTNLIQKIVRALFFFHPAVWWIESRLSVEREMACDDAVLAETANPHGYATCLVSLLEKSLAHRLSSRRWSMAQAAVHRAREAALRLAQILDKNRPVATRVCRPTLAMIGAFSLVCLAVLPLAPQFVAFDRAPMASSSRPAYALTRSSFPSAAGPSVPTAALVPATLRTGVSSSVGTNAKATPANVSAHAVAGRHLVRSPVLAARLKALAPPQRVVEASAGGDSDLEPQFRTLVFVEARQYVMSDSAVWSVRVWRVTLVSTAPEHMARVPVANSI